MSELLIAAVMLVLLIGAIEAGYRVGVRASASLNDQARSQVGTISAGILGLLALLLGFTFGMSLSRFELRKELATKESNAIATTYLRSRLLPEQERKEVVSLLRNYIDARLEFFRAGIDQGKLSEIRDRTQRLQGELWSLVPIAVQKDQREITTGLFIESLNEVFDLESQRLAATENHVPQGILLLLFIVAVIAVLGVGYGCGLAKMRHLFSTTMLAILLMLVTVAIMDLDRPGRGLIKVGQNSLIRLQESLQKDGL